MPFSVLGFMNKGLKGTKEIPFRSIAALQSKDATSFFNGYIQFTLIGGQESTRGIFTATKDENTFVFSGTQNNAKANEIKDFIYSRIASPTASPIQNLTLSLPDELHKLAGLNNQGVLTDMEFQAARRKLID